MAESIIQHAVSAAPLECCGLIAGEIHNGLGTGQARYPLANAACSPTRYLAAPRDLIAAFKAIRAAKLELLAIYHSHPSSAPIPSRFDLESNQYPHVVHVIISLEGSAPEVRGWWLSEREYAEAVVSLGGES
jgi:proteasome lid subunit RPN8/RPN11